MDTLEAETAWALANQDKLRAEDSLYEFTRQAWPVLEPEVPFVGGWAVEAVAEHLQAITEGHITRLLINIPPGCTKSMLTNVMWPAWEWGPWGAGHHRFISAGYEATLPTRDLVRCRDLVRSEWFQARWPMEFKADQDQKTYYENDRTGWRKAASVRSALTGFRGDRIIIDDPHSVKTAESEADREESLRWKTETVPTRLNHSTRSAIVVIMQRLHEQDISGLIINKLGDEWVKLILPMEYEPDRHCTTRVVMRNGKLFTDPRTEDMELLWEERFPRVAVEAMKTALRAHGGTYAEAAQLQQRPTVRGGGMFKRDSFLMWEGLLPEFVMVVRGYDLASSTSSRSAYTASIKLGITRDGRLIILDVSRARMEPLDVERHVQHCAQADGVACRISIPQDPGAAGKAWKAHFAQLLHGFVAHFSPESGDKDFRAEPVAAQVAAGMVYLVPGNWNTDFLAEAASFGPGAAYKDQIDALSRAYAYLIQHRGQQLDLLPPQLFVG